MNGNTDSVKIRETWTQYRQATKQLEHGSNSKASTRNIHTKVPHLAKEIFAVTFGNVFSFQCIDVFCTFLSKSRTSKILLTVTTVVNTSAGFTLVVDTQRTSDDNSPPSERWGTGPTVTPKMGGKKEDLDKPLVVKDSSPRPTTRTRSGLDLRTPVDSHLSVKDVPRSARHIYFLVFGPK